MYAPSELVVRIVRVPVAGSMSVRVAFGMTEPEGSVTVPARLPAVVAWAWAGDETYGELGTERKDDEEIELSSHGFPFQIGLQMRVQSCVRRCIPKMKLNALCSDSYAGKKIGLTSNLR